MIDKDKNHQQSVQALSQMIRCLPDAIILGFVIWHDDRIKLIWGTSSHDACEKIEAALLKALTLGEVRRTTIELDKDDA
jgi:hypothetical protein